MAVEDKVFNAFTEHIGVLGCGLKPCRNMVNDLPGISNELLDKIADGEQETYYGVFKKALRMAVNSLRDDILDIMLRERERKKFGTTLYETERFKRVEPQVFTLTDMVGVLVVTGNSKYVTAKIENIKLELKDDAEARVYVYDLESRETLYEVEGLVPLTEGVNSVVIDYEFDSSKSRAVMVCVEAAGMLIARANCNQFYEADCADCDAQLYLNEYYANYYGFSTLKKSLKTGDFCRNRAWAVHNVTYTADKSIEGLEVLRHNLVGVDLVIDCSIDSFIEQQAGRLAPALLYAVGSNILLEKIGGYRTNYFAKGNMEFTKDTQFMLSEKYKSHLKKIVRALPLSGDSMCWACEDGTVSSSSLV